MNTQRLLWQLANWADWMKQTDSHKLGYPSKAAMISTGGGSSDDEFEIMCDESDTRCAKTMDGIIDSISMAQRTAINHHWLGVAHCYPTQEMDYELALEAIGKLAEKRGLV
jgi:hypothetical protein